MINIKKSEKDKKEQVAEQDVYIQSFDFDILTKRKNLNKIYLGSSTQKICLRTQWIFLSIKNQFIS